MEATYSPEMLVTTYKTIQYQNSNDHTQHALSVFENRVLRIYLKLGQKVTGIWTKLHNEYIVHQMLSHQIKLVTDAHVAHMGKMINAHKFLAGKP
jgi:hypothetical protein